VTTAGQPSVIIYTHPDCTFSAAAKADYRRRRVAYTEVDVAKEPGRIPELLGLSKGERVTPVIVENGKVTIGFKGGY
jgi:glutaredoxin